MSFNNMVYAMSYALDKIESEFIGVTSLHSPRVAYLAMQLGAAYGLDRYQLSDLAACSILHDNALTEYLREEYSKSHMERENLSPASASFGRHCVIGEQNVKGLPFYGNVENAILYHHENYDGSGQFGIRGEQIPLFAALVRLGDSLDFAFDLSCMDEGKYEKILAYMQSNAGVLYHPEHVKVFLETFTLPMFEQMQGEGIIRLLKSSLPTFLTEYSPEQIVAFLSVFAKIIDYKSPFTKDHSINVAKRAAFMGKYYGFSEEHTAKLFLAGALHDIGKMMVDREILEKPGSLTEDEFNKMKDHAYYSFKLLNEIKGFKEIARWAALHHETLDGEGYRFGLDAEQLGFEERLMACLDIYQALSEKRPYKDALPHEEIMGILLNMVENGKLDGRIVNDMAAAFSSQDPTLLQQVV